MLNKKIAGKILSEIKKAKSILLALHVSPDEDCVASVLAMDLILRKMGKKTKLISFSNVDLGIFYFPTSQRIENADFSKINFNLYDLFIALDSAQERMITRSTYPVIFPQSFKIINIDHHVTNTKFGDLNLVAPLSSTAEIIYQLFNLWKVKIDKKLAQALFLGILADTGCFQYPLTSADTLRAAADLMDKGASLKKTVLEIFRSYSINTLKYWGRVLYNMRIDPSGSFIWSTVSRDEKEELGIVPSEIEGAASLFAPIVAGTKFGIILIEENSNLVRGSMRSRDDFDVSKIAVELGGGGHKQAAGFSLKMCLKEAEERVLKTARKYIK